MPHAKPKKAYSAKTCANLASLSKKEGGLEVIAQLGKEERQLSASNWTFRHLIAYRLLVKPGETNFLNIFEHKQCPLCDPDSNSNSGQQLDPRRTKAFTSDCSLNLSQCSGEEIMALPDNFFWAALSEAVSSEDSEASDRSPSPSKRNRKRVAFDNFANSTIAIPASGSSPKSESSEDYEAGPEELDEDEHDKRRINREDATVQLLHCFIRYALSCLVQKAARGGKEVRLRPARRKSTAYISGASITAEDDGGIRLMYRRGAKWTLDNPYLALLEGKRGFQAIDYDDKSGRRKPIVSNNTLAQYLGEAVITWTANHSCFQDEQVPYRTPLSPSLTPARDRSSPVQHRRHFKFIPLGVFLIAGTSTCIRFIHFHFGSDYKRYIMAKSVAAQKALIHNSKLDTCVYMQCTEWFDLHLAQGRDDALCFLLALLRWHEAQRGSHSEHSGAASDDDTDDDTENESEGGSEDSSEDGSEEDGDGDSEDEYDAINDDRDDESG